VTKYVTSEFQKRVCESVERRDSDIDLQKTSVTDEAYERIKALVGTGDPVKPVSLALKSVEKMDFYHRILARLRDGDAPENIARDVVGFVDDLLEDKQNESTGKKGPSGPVFRRVDE